jgi:protein O-GlcNAc transferase
MAKPLEPLRKQPPIQHLLSRALDCHRSGQIATAEQLYAQILQARPDHFEARHLLGVLRGQQGRYEEALELVGAALSIKPDAIGALANYGLILHKLGRHDEALVSLEKALALRPDDADALNNRGNALAALGRYDEALGAYDRSLSFRPDHAEALNNRGNVLAALGRYEEAHTSYVKALLIRPDNAEAHYHRGNVLAKLDRYEDALRSYERAIAARPNYGEALDNRGNALAKLGRYEEALASYDRALALQPRSAGTLTNRGIALEELRQYDAALRSYDAALEASPDDPGALSNRGNVLTKLKFYDEALTDYDRALAIRPDNADTSYNRGNVLAALRRYEQAQASYEAALAVRPDDANACAGLAGAVLACCKWERLNDIGRDLAAHASAPKSAVGPFALLGYHDDPALLRHCAENFTAQQIPVSPAHLYKGAKVRNEKIRLAYLSADFRSHVMAYQVAELFELHDRGRFEVIGVSYGSDDKSEIRARLVNGFDRFDDVISKSDADVARLLNEIEVDIAVDLMGHTRDARIGILGHRPAPVQVSYLGYAGTTGASFVDYIIGDPVVTPFDQQPFYTERIVQLPECFFVNDSKRAISARAPQRSEAGLPERAFVFCCFNNPGKIRPPMFDIWMRLLQAVEGSVLWLRDSGARDNLRREAAARGVDSDRLVFAGRVADMAEHLARHRLADLFLDTLPYNAHATASDALWAGLPVLTCRGRTFAARVGASLIQAVGLGEMVTSSLDDYEALALRLAGNSQLLAGLRCKLEHNLRDHPLFDTERFCRHLEDAYTTMWKIRQRGDPPQSFVVPARDAAS